MPSILLNLLLISCGNANRQSVVEQSETEITQESIEETSPPTVRHTLRQSLFLHRSRRK